MEPTQELIDSIFREKVLRARRRTPEEKMLAGAQLFEEVCERMDSGIRAQFPEADEIQVRTIRSQWLRRLRRVQEHNVWK